ncbi:NAD(P)/FAD-dependent oxidoreductase [Spirosoma rigui]|uniref:NAD(P)/FAD-dependent oxidoreductase n=1 Tax=Spirosoma rigui TaxID=564064 RepID=UPI0009B0B714|nr:FAD-dependent oxidoreductase [Spirosoma rigui]
MPSSLIIGAGMAGLTAARELSRHGWNVTVLDKGRGLGGRLATRRLEQARLDHGAQYFSATTPEFQETVQALVANGVSTEWPLNGGDTTFGQPRYIGIDGMNTVAKALAKNLTVRTGETVIAIRPVTNGWLVETASGQRYPADTLLITIPAPQALSLLQQSDYILPVDDAVSLAAIDYEPCLAVMAALNQSSALPEPGAFRYETGDIAWIVDNTRKGISPNQPSVTIHASADFSRAHFDSDLDGAGQYLLQQVSQWIPAGSINAVQVHRWRYSLARQRHPAPFLAVNTVHPLLFGGDGFGAGNVEGAYTSGLQMARFLTAT